METSKATKEKNPKKDVEIFGEPQNDKSDFNNRISNYHDRHGSLAFGILFIVIGFVFLLSNFGALPPLFLTNLLKLWPLLIVFVGIDIILGKTILGEFAKSIISIFVLLTIIGVVFLNTTPQLLNGFPPTVLNYLNMLNNFVIQIK